MKKVKITYETFSFDELSKLSQSCVVNKELINLMERVPYEDLTDNQKKGVDEAEKMQTPWFTGSYIMDYAREEILDLCKMGTYLKDGSYFWQGECGQFETENI